MVRGNSYPIMLEMLRGTITGCSSAESGGGIWAADKSHVVLVDVQIDACQATGEHQDGGGIHVDGASLTMSGGAIRACEALNGDGGALHATGLDAQVRLSGVTVHGCKALYGAFLSATADAVVRLADVRVEDCVTRIPGGANVEPDKAAVNAAGCLHAERLQVIRSGGWTLNGLSDCTDCTFSDGTGFFLEGVSRFTRTAFLRFITRTANGHPSPFQLGTGARVMMIDSLISDCRGDAGHDEPRYRGCFNIWDSNTLVLRNTTLRNCSTAKSPCLSFVEAASFQSELLTLEPSCEEDPTAALIRIHSGSSTVNARGLQVVAPAACASTNFTVFSANMRPMNCSDGENVCGNGATCTDVQPLSVAPKFTTVSCLCPHEYFPNPNATSRALAPYGFDPSAIGLPDDFDPTIIGLPRTTVDYCVRSSKNLNLQHTRVAGRSRTRICPSSRRSRRACRWSRT